MDKAISEEKLKTVLDQITREVMVDSAGIQLVQGDAEPGDDVYTVHVSFSGGAHSSLSLRADTTMLTRLAQSMLKVEKVTPEDLEDVTKEYFNIVCGRIARAFYQATHMAARFNVPSFCRGSYSPKDRQEQFTLNYSDERNEAAQLVHHIPNPQPGEAGLINSISTERGNESHG